jgi:hypothetical protein
MSKKSHVIRVYNNSSQLIPLQVRSPNGDFYTSEQQVRIAPNKSVVLPKSHVRQDQIENLQKRGMIRVVYDSEITTDKQAANL